MVAVDGVGARSRRRVKRPAFLRTTWACQVWVTSAFVAALVLPLLLADLGHGRIVGDPTTTGVLLVAASIVNIEFGRLLEGGVSETQRPHKGLSAWAFASALLLPPPWLLPVVAVTYGHAWWRGLRVTPWKWVGSAAYVVLAALAAAAVAHAVLGDQRDLMRGDGQVGLAAVLLAAASFLVVETVLFHGSAYLNHADDEVWLRRTLAGASFYVTELGVLLIGGLSAAIWIAGGWFALLLIPVYLTTQRAALHEPLRERAEHDDKTGALRFESWRRQAVAAAARCCRRGRPWCVLFTDLDEFRAFNETWGHLVGDQALAAVAAATRAELRAGDLLGRFGGEEFCAFLPDVDVHDARAIAERIRCAVASTDVPGGGAVTVSIGLATVAGGAATPFGAALTAADRALYRAKRDGRDRTCAVAVEAG